MPALLLFRESADLAARLLEPDVAAAIDGTPSSAVTAMANVMLTGLIMARLKMAAAFASIALMAAGIGLALSSAPAFQPGPRPSLLRPAQLDDPTQINHGR